MGHTVNKNTLSNRQILEGLWAQGIDPNRLKGIDTGGSQTDFLARLHDMGINADQTTRAQNIVAWRPDAGNVNDFIKTLQIQGVSDSQIRQIVQSAAQKMSQPGIRTSGQQLDFMGLGGSLRDLGAIKLDPGLLTEAASGILPPQILSQAKIKTGQTQGMTQDQWNPYRDDVGSVPPPSNAPTGPGGVTMGTNVSRATPGVAAPSTVAGTPKPTPTGPSKAPGSGGTTGGAGGGAGGAQDKGLPKNASDDQVVKWFQQNYGADAWMVDVPDFKGLMREIATTPGGMSQSMVNSRIQATPWWQQNGQHVADFITEQHTSGRQLNDKILDKQHRLDTLAAQYGITLSPERNLAIATDWQKYQWDDTAVNSAIAGEFHYQNNQHTAFTDKLKTDAKDYLVPVGDDTIQQWGRRIIQNGPAEETNFQTFLKEQAKSMFPTFAARLDGGETMSAIAQPYASLAGQYLEMDPKDVDFTNPKWMPALDQVDDKGNHTSMSYADWTNKLKTDSQYRYDYTQQAKQAATGMATDLLKKFGAIA